MELDRLSLWLLPWFFVVRTNCQPVAESLSCCLLKISGKARGERERGTQTDTEREPCLIFLTAGHPATSKVHPPHSSFNVGIPIDHGPLFKQFIEPFSLRFSDPRTPPCPLSKLCWLCTGRFDIVYCFWQSPSLFLFLPLSLSLSLLSHNIVKSTECQQGPAHCQREKTGRP